jgi:hypothetical protein
VTLECVPAAVLLVAIYRNRRLRTVWDKKAAEKEEWAVFVEYFD